MYINIGRGTIRARSGGQLASGDAAQVMVRPGASIGEPGQTVLEGDRRRWPTVDAATTRVSDLAGPALTCVFATTPRQRDIRISLLLDAQDCIACPRTPPWVRATGNEC